MRVPGDIIAGTKILRHLVAPENTLIGIEDNKPDAIEALRKACPSDGSVTVGVMKTKYPQGSEKHLIQAVLKRQVPLGGLPSDVGVAIGNVATHHGLYGGFFKLFCLILVFKVVEQY